MTQKQFDTLLTDGYELYGYFDMSELTDFFAILADKYKLFFDYEVYKKSIDGHEYLKRIEKRK